MPCFVLIKRCSVSWRERRVTMWGIFCNVGDTVVNAVDTMENVVV